MPYTSINGFRMFYDVRGEGDVIAFVHGGFPSLDMHLRADATGAWGWEMDFASEFRYVMYDRRGCWLSSRPESGYDLENQAHDLAELLDHLNIESAHVIGSSAGGPIAILFATQYPERVRTLALAGTAAHLWPDEDPVSRIIEEQLEILYKQGDTSAWNNRPEGVELSLDVLWERDEMEERGTLGEYEARVKSLVARSSLQERIEWYGTQLRSIDAYRDRDLSVECGRIRAPTLVVHGARDREVPLDWGRDLAAKIPGAEFRVYPDKPHSVIHGSKSVREDLLAFFRKAG
ncbi:MAG: alpha/beta hydrolase [Candidatus Latescibacteria bacterium]|nr:alpha/beta hydrolase [Candidatus Latescibacterota bacterium]